MVALGKKPGSNKEGRVVVDVLVLLIEVELVEVVKLTVVDVEDERLVVDKEVLVLFDTEVVERLVLVL